VHRRRYFHLDDKEIRHLHRHLVDVRRHLDRDELQILDVVHQDHLVVDELQILDVVHQDHLVDHLDEVVRQDVSDVVVVDAALHHQNQMDYFRLDVALSVADVALQFRMDYFHQVLLVVLEY
jgi:hypothetical protein